MFAESLNELASQCDYEECCRDKLCRDVFISGLKSSKIMTTAIHDSEGKSFSDVVKRAKTIEQVQIDVADINDTAKPYVIQNQVKKVEHTFKNEKKLPSSYVCIRCGAAGKHVADACWAKTRTCNMCGKLGHIGKACKKPKNSKFSGSKKDTNYIKLNEYNEEDDDPAKYFTMHKIIDEISTTTPQATSTAHHEQATDVHTNATPDVCTNAHIYTSGVSTSNQFSILQEEFFDCVDDTNTTECESSSFLE